MNVRTPAVGAVPEQHSFAAGRQRVCELVNTAEIFAETTAGGNDDLFAVLWPHPLIDDDTAVDFDLLVCHVSSVRFDP